MMDSEVSVLLHCAAWKGLLKSQVQVELSDRYNRQTDPTLECHIEEVWTQRVSKEPWLFNGSKFRLHSFCLASPSTTTSSCASPEHQPSVNSAPFSIVSAVQEKQDMDINCRKKTKGQFCPSYPVQNALDNSNTPVNQEESGDNADWDLVPALTLKMGLTCYKDYLGTNWSCRAAELRQQGGAEFEDPLALLAQPLGVGAILCTADGQVVLIRRSQKVAEAAGLLDIPGGHPEPKVVCERLGQVVNEDQIRIDMMERRAVVSELFSSICAEIRDEVNVPLASLREPLLLGVALNHTSAGRPSAEFYVSCSLTSDEVRKLYWKGGAEANESTDIVFLSREEVLQLDRNSHLWSELCPSAKGAVQLYQTVKLDAEHSQWSAHNSAVI